MTPADIAKIRALADAATEGPWIGFGFGPADQWVRVTRDDWPDDPVCDVTANVSNQKADAAFIAASRAAVPELCATVEELTTAYETSHRNRMWAEQRVGELEAERDSALARAEKAERERDALVPWLRVLSQQVQTADEEAARIRLETLFGMEPWPPPTVPAILAALGEAP
jgi:hypothetical protein